MHGGPYCRIGRCLIENSSQKAVEDHYIIIMSEGLIGDEYSRCGVKHTCSCIEWLLITMTNKKNVAMPGLLC